MVTRLQTGDGGLPGGVMDAGKAEEPRCPRKWALCFDAIATFPDACVAMLRLANLSPEDLTRRADPWLCEKGDTLLTRCARCGSVEGVRLLLDRGAPADLPSRTGAAALFVASQEGHPACVELLLSRGASLAARTPRGLLAVHAAINPRGVNCLRALHVAGADLGARTVAPTGPAKALTPAHLAAALANMKALEYLAANGANLFQPDDAGRTPLDAAIAPDSRAFLIDVLRVGGAAASVAWARHVRSERRMPLVLVRALRDRGRATHRPPLDGYRDATIKCLNYLTANRVVVLVKAADEAKKRKALLDPLPDSLFRHVLQFL